MNERLKELAEQAGLFWQFSPAYEKCLEHFAELVRQDEAQACAKHYLAIMRDAVEQAVLKEREACAVLVEGGKHVHPKAPDAVWAKTVAKLIRARGKPNPAFKNYMGDNWAGIV